MNSSIKQAIILVACSVIIGFSFNLLRPNGIPIFAKQLQGYNEDLEVDGFIIQNIDLKVATKFLDDKILFIDARDLESFNKGHITGAIQSIPYVEMVDKIFNKQGFNQPIAIYCDDAECGLSEELAFQLQSEGFSKIYVFGGGWNKWIEAGLPIEL